MARPIHLLSNVKLQQLAKRKGKHHDGGGLYLRVVPPHQCSWIYRYAIKGAEQTLGLGSFPTISLQRARELAADARTKKADGVDPVAAKRDERAKARLEAAKSKTFRACAEEYMAAHSSEWTNDKHRAQWSATLRDYAYPIFRDLPVSAIDRDAVLLVLSPIWKDKRETANRLRGRIEAVLAHATASGYRQGDNPARWQGNLEHSLAKREEGKHLAALPYADLPAFMTALRAIDGAAARALEFCILTAARSGEVRGATWGEIEDNVWMVPAERMKAGKAHNVPLSDRALAILQEMKGNGTYIFPGARVPMLTELSMLTVLRGIKPGLTVHGFRSTFRDWCGDKTEFPREVAEAALAHAVGDDTEAAYRRSNALDKRRLLMEAWAAYCSGEAAADNVVPMATRRYAAVD